MDFDFKEENGILIVKPRKNVLDFEFLFKIKKRFKKESFALDCKYIEEIKDHKAVNFIIKNSINLFNLSPFVLLAISLFDTKNFVNLYLNEKDCLFGGRKILRRRFKIA